jgi:uncharacterized protein YndB with AHSA1/START domain
MKTAVINKEELLIERVFDAPRELVWKCWSDTERFSRWFGPRGFSVPFCKLDFKVGGQLHFAMRSPEGKDYWGVGSYREIVEPERIVYTDHFSNEAGDIVPGTYYGLSEGFPLEMVVSITLEEYPSAGGGKTRLTLKHGNIKDISETDRNDMNQGWSQSFDKLSEELQPQATDEPGEWQYTDETGETFE